MLTNIFVLPVQAAPRDLNIVSDIRALLVQVDQKIVQPIKDIDTERVKDVYYQGQYLAGLHKQYVENSKEVVRLNKEIASATKELKAVVQDSRNSDAHLTDTQLLQIVASKRNLQVHMKQTVQVTKKVGIAQGKYLKHMKNQDWILALNMVKTTVSLQEQQMDALEAVLTDLQELIQVFQ